MNIDGLIDVVSIVDYFIERRVVSDDPFTEEVEAAVPFALAVLVSNDGFGVARSLAISSSQPTIVDNRKGLLVDFEIVSAHVNGALSAQSLHVPIGDVESLSTANVVWSMVSSLSGEFRAFNATYRQLSPADGEPLLTNVVQSVRTHRLTRVVSLRSSLSPNGTVAFLADDVPDLDAMPDTLFAGRLAEPIAPLLVANASLASTLFSSSDANTTTLTLTALAAMLLRSSSIRFYYVRIVDPFADARVLLGATSATTNASAIDAWREQYVERPAIGEARVVRWLHLFANLSDGFVWRLQTVASTAPVLRLVNVTSSTATVTWDDATAAAGTSTLDIAVMRAGGSVNGIGVVAHTSVAATIARHTIGDLLPDTEYNLRVTAVVGGGSQQLRFRTQQPDSSRGASSLVVCGAATQCEHDALLDDRCRCTCRQGFVGERCERCELACANGGVARLFNGRCACACPLAFVGALCDERPLDSLDGCANVTFSPSPVDVRVCFKAPRPTAVRLVPSSPPSSSSMALVAFNVSSSTSFGAVSATFSVRNLPSPLATTTTRWRYALRSLDNDGVWRDASLSCASSSANLQHRQQSFADGSLIAFTCKLASFIVVIVDDDDDKSPSTPTNSPTSSTTATSIMTTNVVPSSSTTMTSSKVIASSSKAGLIGGIIGGFIALGLVAGLLVYWRRRRHSNNNNNDRELEENKPSSTTTTGITETTVKNNSSDSESN
jgi:hypothetical protein